MKHFVFHLGFMVSEVVPAEDYEGEIVQDFSRRQFDIHIHAEDFESASGMIQRVITQVLEPQVLEIRLPYVGPV